MQEDMEFNSQSEFLQQTLTSKAYVPPTVNTTVKEAALVGATNFTVLSTEELAKSGSITLIIDANAPTAEVVNIALSALGTSPYTVALVTGTVLQHRHASGAPVQSAATHIFRFGDEKDESEIDLLYQELYRRMQEELAKEATGKNE